MGDKEFSGSLSPHHRSLHFLQGRSWATTVTRKVPSRIKLLAAYPTFNVIDKRSHRYLSENRLSLRQT